LEELKSSKLAEKEALLRKISTLEDQINSLQVEAANNFKQQSDLENALQVAKNSEVHLRSELKTMERKMNLKSEELDRLLSIKQTLEYGGFSLKVVLIGVLNRFPLCRTASVSDQNKILRLSKCLEDCKESIRAERQRLTTILQTTKVGTVEILRLNTRSAD
jgi:chromosome segregation ATPase